MLVRTIKLLAIGLCALGFGLSAQAGPAMFNASFTIHAWGNDITSGTIYPYNDGLFSAVPMGNDCQSASPTTGNGSPAPRYCTSGVFQVGVPATGMGALTKSTSTVQATGAAFALSTSAFSVDVTGFLRTYYPYLQSHTYASFVNEAGSFFAGGGPAAGKGEVTHTGMGQQLGTWFIHEGKNGFGGVMGLLGAYGAKAKYVVPGKAGTYIGTGSWVIIPQMGREQYATVIGTAMSKATAWQNPYEKQNAYVNNLNSNVSSLQARGTGSPWTTGTVTVWAKAGYFTTSHMRSGFDTLTPGGVRNIQLVTPTLTHWTGPAVSTHTGQVGILNLQVPEPRNVALLAGGIAALALLYRTSRRR